MNNICLRLAFKYLSAILYKLLEIDNSLDLPIKNPEGPQIIKVINKGKN